jgi:redox-sensitive bicupin YhaK (pirin superfamily)
MDEMKRRAFIKNSAISGFAIASPTLLSASGMFSSSRNRKVYRILNADRAMVGTLPILRAFAGDHVDHVSPFVLLDEFGPVDLNSGTDPLRVDAHPHAGVIPTTYFLSGSGHHKDSLNYDFQVEKGEFMMFNSGRGAIHMEETGQKMYDEGGNYHGFQIWLNMPAKYKFTDPTTVVHKGKSLPEIEHELYHAKVILGELFGVKSEAELLSPAFYYHIKLKAGCRIDIPTEAHHNAFVYVIAGELEIEGQKALKKNQLALYQRGDDLINLFAEHPAEILVMGGQPLNEPVYSYGPFVMNSEDEIRKCYADYRAGKMGDPNVVNQ